MRSDVEAATPSLKTAEETLAVSDGFAIVQGHPHRDEGDPTTRPATAEIDDLVEKWAADQRGVEGGADPIRLRSGEGEYMLLPFSEGTYVRFALADGAVRFLPGAPDAVEAGCICDPGTINYGRDHR